MRFLSVLSLVVFAVAPAQAADWIIDPTASTLSFSGIVTGTPFTGHFKHFSGDIQFDSTNPAAGSAHIHVDMSSATTDEPQKDQALPEPDWFDVKKFPEALFETSGFVSKGGENYEAAGKLSIRGVTMDCILPFTLTMEGDLAHAKGKVTLMRQAFSVGQGSWATDKWVAYPVIVDVDIKAKKK